MKNRPNPSTTETRRIGLVSLFPVDPHGAAAARLAHSLAKGLNAEGHEVTLFAPPSPAAEGGNVVPIRCGPPLRFPRLHRLIVRLRPFGCDYTSAIRRHLREHARSLDWVIGNETFSGWLAHATQRPVVLHDTSLRALDVEGGASNAQSAPGIRRMLRAERRLTRITHMHATASRRVAARLAEWAPTAEIAITPVTLDLDHYEFIPTEIHRRSLGQANLFGTMKWASTADSSRHLIQNLWPVIRSDLPSARLQVVGDGATTLLRPDAEVSGVELHDRVPDIVPFWRQAGVLLFPCGSGSGVKLKVMEALAYGIPVVTTPSGAEGLDLVDGESALICRTDEEFVSGSRQLLGSPEMQERLRRAGRQHLEEHLGLAKVARAFVAAGERARQFSSLHG